MKATDFLKKQHTLVKELFEQIEKASSREEKKQLFQSLATNLVGHDAIERQLFYPACEKAMGMTPELGEALVEHGVVEFSVYQADEALRGKNAEADEFDYKCKVLQEIVEHHVKEEEDEFFPKVEKALSSEELEDLTDELEDLFADQLQKDFHVGLYANLQQVFAGVIKTSAPEEESEEDLDASAEMKAQTAARKGPLASERAPKKGTRRSA